MTNSRGTSLRTFAISILLLTVFLRIPSLVHPRAIDDEAVYSVVGNQIAEGGRPYVDAVERKPPLLFWTYAAIIKMGGEYNWPFLHAAALLWVVATMAGFYAIGRGLFNPLTGLFAALLYSLYQPWLKFIDLAFNGEVVMNLPIVWGWAIAFSKSRSRARPELLVSGMLLCASFLLKQPAAIAAIPLGLYFLLPSYQKSRGITFSTGVLQAAVFTAGFFGTLALTGLILWKQGILRDTIYWTITNHTVAHIFWTTGFLHTLAFLGACLPLVLGSVISYRNRAGLWATHSAERTALAGLVIVSAIGAAAGARFYPHYYIQLIPPLAILAAPVFAHVFSTPNNRPLWLKPSVVTAALVITFLAFSITYWIGEVPSRKPTEAGEYVRTHSKPDDRIFVWGQNPEMYLDAQRRPACRYVVTFPLTGYIFGGIYYIDTNDRIVPGTWDKLDQDFKAHPPVYIIDVHEDPKNAQYPILQFPVLARWLKAYQAVTEVKEGIIYRAIDAFGTKAPAD
jgi:4-amino-4-deoxy-L-arabinose transferase-like glycosyltransferase